MTDKLKPYYYAFFCTYGVLSLPQLFIDTDEGWLGTKIVASLAAVAAVLLSNRKAPQ